MQKAVEAQDSDLQDVLAYVAFASDPVPRVDRAALAKEATFKSANDKQSAFVEFLLGQYVERGIDKLVSSRVKLLLELR